MSCLQCCITGASCVSYVLIIPGCSFLQLAALAPYSALLREAGESPDESPTFTPETSSPATTRPSCSGVVNGNNPTSGVLQEDSTLGSRSSLARTTPPSPPWQDEPGQLPLPLVAIYLGACWH